MQIVLNAEEAGSLLRMSIPAVRGLAASGEIPAIQMGNEWRFLQDQLIDYMATRAKDEQRRRQELHAEKKEHPVITTEPAKRGRPSKKVDLSRYQ